jgi:GxxExxY protein
MLAHQSPQSHKDTKESTDHKPLSQREETIARGIVEAAFRVHTELGAGLLEKVYEVCFCHELSKLGFHPVRQVNVPITYDGISFDEGLRLDVLVDDLVICELKAVEIANSVWDAQILSHMKLTGKRLGFLINFNVPLIRNGLKRFIL